jgi:hypothetical protein
VLLDTVHVANEEDERSRQLVYCTLYDTTYRYNNDSRWYREVAALFPKLAHKGETASVADGPARQSLTQVFFSVADCNLDYITSVRFKTASRTMLRVGFLRLSSNVVRPSPAFQAFSITLGDASLYLCNNRYPYNFENRHLLGAQATLKPSQLKLASIKLPENAEPDDVLRSMNYKTMLTLDALDAIVSMSNSEQLDSTDAPLSATLTIGQLCMFACKDSLQRLLRTVGELSTELTALTDDALEVLRAKSVESRRIQSLQNAATRSDRSAQGRESMAIQKHADFSIDGYDWMTIDSEDSGKLGISQGEEHAARWYGSDELDPRPPSLDEVFITDISVDASQAGNAIGGPRIIAHHFPLNPVFDPIGDGDMGLSTFVGPNVKPKVQLRFTVSDLAFKIHFFDGYDWPECIDAAERNAATCDSFVIPIATVKATEPEVPLRNQRKESVRVDRKSKLMGDLLAGDEGHDSPFQDIPLPEERKKTLKEQAEMRRLARRTSKFFQIAGSGLSVRFDSIGESSEHRLVSCLNLKFQDLYVAETISSNRPVKLLGEWFNEQEHPRDSKDGLVMMKVSIHGFALLVRVPVFALTP